MGIHVNNIITNDPNDKIIAAYNYDNSINDTDCLIVATKNGLIKRTLIKDLAISKSIKLTSYINLNDKDEVVSCLKSSTNEQNKNVGVITKNGMALMFPINQISLVSKNAAGVKSINLKDQDSVATIFIDEPESDLIFIGCQQGFKRIKKTEINVGMRANVGRMILSQIKSNPLVVIDAFNIKANDTIIYLAANNI